MGYFHSHFNYIRRAQDQSVIKMAASNSGEQLFDNYNCKTYDYSYRTDVLLKNIMRPPYAPREFENRQILWTEVDRVEKRGDAITAREVIFPLYRGLSHNEQIELLLRYASTFFVSHGMCADISLHEKSDGYSHAHVLLTTRSVDCNGFGAKKNHDWADQNLKVLWQLLWSDALNQALERKGIVVEINPEEHFRHGISYGSPPPKGLGFRIKTFLEYDGLRTDHLADNIAFMDKRERANEM